MQQQYMYTSAYTVCMCVYIYREREQESCFRWAQGIEPDHDINPNNPAPNTKTPKLLRKPEEDLEPMVQGDPGA